MKMLVVLALAAVAYAEPEADAQVFMNGVVPSVYSAGVVPSVYSTTGVKVVPSVYSHVASAPVAVAPRVTYTSHHAAVAAPAVTYSAAVAAPYAAVAPYAANSLTVTNINNPDQYTAVEHTPFGNHYVAKNGPVVHKVKREADAQIVTAYNTALPIAAAYHHPTVYNTGVVGAVAPYVSAVNGAVAAPYVSAVNGIHSSHVGLCLNYMGQQVSC